MIGLAIISLVVIAIGFVLVIKYVTQKAIEARQMNTLEGRQERIRRRRYEIRRRLESTKMRRTAAARKGLNYNHPRMIALNGLIDNLQRQLDHENLRLEEIETEIAIRDFERSNEIE